MTEPTRMARTEVKDQETLIIDNCIFEDLSLQGNEDWREGGAIYFDYSGHGPNGALFIMASQFINCRASRTGGAIRAISYQTFEINTTTAQKCFTNQGNEEEHYWGQFLSVDGGVTSETNIKSIQVDQCPAEIVKFNQRPLRMLSEKLLFTDSNISNCVCTYCFGFYAGRAELDVSYINVVNGSALAVAVELENCTGSLKHISFDRVKQEYANMSVIYYLNSTVTMDAFSFTNYDINLSAYLFGYSKKEDPLGHATLSNLVCVPDFPNVQEADPNVNPTPENPTQEPENPTQEPEKPTQEPEKPTQEPEKPTQEPEKSTPAPTQISSSSGQPANVDERKADKGGLGSGVIAAIVIVVIVVIVVIIVVIYFFVIRKNHGYQNDIGSDTGSAETEEEIPAPGAVADEKMMGRTVDYQTKDDSIVYATQTNGPDVDIVP